MLWLKSRDMHGNGIPISMGFASESHGTGNTNMPRMGMGIGRVHVTMGMGIWLLFMCAKIPISRLDANGIQ